MSDRDSFDARRLQLIHQALNEFETRVRQLSVERRHLIDKLIAQGWSQTEVADMLGVTRSRISQMVATATTATRKDDPN